MFDDGNSKLTSDSVPQSSQQLSADGGNVKDDGWKIKHKERDFITLLPCTPGQFLTNITLVEVENTTKKSIMLTLNKQRHQ